MLVGGSESCLTDKRARFERKGVGVGRGERELSHR